ncbi:MotA/TolQ/ExbB proton channel family protein [Pusillimonas sp. CC-YST705]|uniref:MotA/TolQ/ExbB proton channel family protein n=1 Tax=Mesopusillimonas faecipullorum TaxID=2755040 RepID=A0ABS8CA19_9BURK|nr:MotA/TolQ/ExbB proton channel family protein [Mesopusillimonas faecipullorum]MCB5362881.1 MotA/TolQ/ExbB proton channel family protein [Mesopusillimonas faecipullorum]
MLQIIHEAGWPIWLLLITSVFGLAIIIERTLSLRKRRVLPPGLLDEVIALVRRQHDLPANLERLAGSSPLGRVLAEVVAVRGQSDAYRHTAIEEVGKDAAWQLERYLPGLATIAVIAPLMGLFGTVVGMIEIFASYTPDGGDPSQLARGIAIALYNTGFGILLAIPALIMHRFYRTRVDYFTHQLERQATTLDRILSGHAARAGESYMAEDA